MISIGGSARYLRLSILPLFAFSISIATLDGGDKTAATQPIVRIQKDGPPRIVGSKTPSNTGKQNVGPRGDTCGTSPSFDNGNSDSTTFTVGNPDYYYIYASGDPTPYVSFYSGDSLPGGMGFQDGNGDGSAYIYGNPNSGTSGDYHFTLQAENFDPCDNEQFDVYQDFTLTVVEAPSFTSADNTTFTVGQFGTFTVTTAGDSPISLSLNIDDLPSGVTFVDNGDGTATLSGVPAPGSDSSAWNPQFKASNSVDDTLQDFTLTVNPAPAATDCVSPPSGLVSWWPGDGNRKDIADGNDMSDNGSVGTGFNNGEVGQAFSFAGNGYLTAGNPSNLKLSGTGVTIDAWVNPTNSGESGIIVGKTSDSANDYLLYLSGGTLVGIIKAGGSETLINGGTVPDGVWSHVALTYDGNAIKIYVNANQIDSVAKSGNLDGTDSEVAIGGRVAGDLNFVGLIDEVEVFNRALGADEVFTIYDAGSFGKCKCTPPPWDMISWWPGDGNANDIRGFNDGTVHGDVTFVAGKVGQGFNFGGNAASDYVSVGDVDLPGTFTIDAWINLSDLSTLPQIFRKTSSYALQIDSGGSITATVNPGGASSTLYQTDPGLISTNTWQHVAVTYDGNAPAGEKFVFYVNGSAVVSHVFLDNGGAPVNNPNPAQIGLQCPGLVDEVEVFKRVLCADEIAAISRADHYGKCKPTLNVDFGLGNSPVQAGFFGFNINSNSSPDWYGYYPTDISTAPSGTATVHVGSSSGNDLAGDFNTTPPDSGAFNFSNLYRDFIEPSAGSLHIDLQSLAPNTAFDVTFYAYDQYLIDNSLPNSTIIFTDTTFGGSVPNTSITIGSDAGQVSSNRQFASRLRVVSDVNGNINFSVSSSGPIGAPVVNGIQVAPVPSASACAEPTPSAQHPANVSTRVNVGTGDNVGIAGFIIHTDPPPPIGRTRVPVNSKTVLIRGLGPSLAASGISNPLPDPVLDLYDADGNPIAHNDNWVDAGNASDIQNSGAAPSSALESVILIDLAADSQYTAILRGNNGGTGVGLVEVYDADFTGDSHFANISTRGNVGLNDNVMIAGIIVRGGIPCEILFRALGPSLTNAGVPNTLQDPTLDIYDEHGTLLAHNDNWKEEPDGTPNANREAQITATGLAPGNDSESAILYLGPAPGNYTGIVRGAGGTTGNALIEAYRFDLPQQH